MTPAAAATVSPGAARRATGSRATPLVLVAGNPNAGKSTLFNALTGAAAKVSNYPGVTVARTSATVRLSDGRQVEFVDLLRLVIRQDSPNRVSTGGEHGKHIVPGRIASRSGLPAGQRIVAEDLHAPQTAAIPAIQDAPGDYTLCALRVRDRGKQQHKDTCPES